MNYQTMDGAAAVITAPPLSRAYTCPVPHFLEAVGVVRRRAQGVLAAWGLSRDAAEEALLVISELVTNAVVHALPPAELRLFLQHDGVRTVLRVEVTDAGPAPAPAWPGSTPLPDEHGRGTAVIQGLALRHGTDSRPGTTTWWADLPAF